MTRNVLFSWAGQSVFVVAGFILPRMIDRHIGQEALGVWDFGWSLTAYCSLLQAGLVSSINPYVAKCRATGDLAGVNQVVSSVLSMLLILGSAALGLTVVMAVMVPSWLEPRLGEHLHEARWVVFLLGTSLTVQIISSAFGGVLTGCHRWDLHNALYAGGHAATVTVMVVSLALGAGLRGLALVNLCGELLVRALEVAAAHYVLPGLSVRPSQVRWSVARRMLRFGSKTFAFSSAVLIRNQTTGIILLAYLGPAALALYSRPMALLRHATIMMQRFAVVLTPTVSSLHATGNDAEIRDLLVKSTRYGAYAAMPVILMIAILGDAILQIWMGAQYRLGFVLVALAMGHLAFLVQRPVFNILLGLDAHGRPALANLIAAVSTVGLAVLAVGPLRSGLLGAALAVVTPLTLVNGIYIPLHACRRLRMPLMEYVAKAFGGPALCMLPFGLCLALIRLILADKPLAALGCSVMAALLVLGPLYWRYALPGAAKRALALRLRSAFKTRQGTCEPARKHGQP